MGLNRYTDPRSKHYLPADCAALLAWLAMLAAVLMFN